MPKPKPLTDLVGYRGKEAMSEEAARKIAERIAIQLIRGSIEQARHTLEDGWRDHLESDSELPSGPSLLDEPLSRVLSDVRSLNGLEREGVLTIGHLIATAACSGFTGIPNMGPKTVVMLEQLAQSMRERAA